MLALLIAALAAPPAVRVLPPGQLPDDQRLTTTRDVNGHHPSELRESPADWWLHRRPQLVTQTLVSQGLWPLPPRTALRPVVHTPIDQGEYTVEHVLLNTRPGHYLAGNLYRPKGPTRRRGAVLFAHGHWANGRFHDAGADAAKKDLESGGERFAANARFLLQTMPAALARQGYVAFA